MAKLVQALFGLAFICQCNAQAIGFYWWTWSSNPTPPAGTNMGIAFSGWADPNEAVSDSAACKNKLPGVKYIDIGGGNANGAWSSSQLNSVINAINNNSFSGYGGICFDVEEGQAGLSSAFESAFKAAKAHGYQVLVTISHSAPYGFSDASTLMSNFFASTNIDYISPQLYTSGNEKQNDYSTDGGVSWNAYQKSRAKIAPSIVQASYYPSAQQYFAGQGVTLSGYIQWAN